MNVEPIVLLQRERQLLKEAPLFHAEPSARPLDRGLRCRIEGYGRGADRLVMVAEHGHGAALDQAHHRLEGPFRIGAVSDIVAEQNHSLRPTRPRSVEACFKCLPVGVNVREDGQQHVFPLQYRPPAPDLAGIKQHASIPATFPPRPGGLPHSDLLKRGVTPKCQSRR